jgi:hypothetical protein
MPSRPQPHTCQVRHRSAAAHGRFRKYAGPRDRAAETVIFVLKNRTFEPGVLALRAICLGCTAGRFFAIHAGDMSERDAFGPNLRRIRVQRGIPLDRISEATKVSSDFWVGLERNDFSRWPSGIYARAYVRAYAFEIGVDPEATVNEFCRWFPQGDRRASRVVKEQAAIVGHELQWKDDLAPGMSDRRAQPPDAAKEAPAPSLTRMRRVTAAGADVAVVLLLSTVLKSLLPIGWIAALAAVCVVYHTAALVSIGSSPAVWALDSYLEHRHPHLHRAKSAPRLLRLREKPGRV